MHMQRISLLYTTITISCLSKPNPKGNIIIIIIIKINLALSDKGLIMRPEPMCPPLHYFGGRVKWIETNHKACCSVCLKMTCP